MIELRDYQLESIEGLRQGLREGHLRQILCAPTAAGKTVMGAHLIAEALGKGRKAAFVCDRVALVHQTSQRFAEFRIPHGIAQGENTVGRWLPVQVCSAQTIEKRGFRPDLDLVIVDEAHAQRKATTKFIQGVGKPVIGLTATPFSKGLGQVYTRVVNVTTTDKLIAEGWLAPLKVYSAKAIDMQGAKTGAGGEWLASEVEQRGTRIVGDIVSSWTEKTAQHFGGPVKTIVFSATVAHGEQLCREFQAAGHDFRQISYKDGNDAKRAALIEGFRRGDILGLVSCEALAKGFDVADILCGISARPYRKSLAAHIQQIGRAMRSAPGKEYALWLDHAGNYLGFLDETLEFFASGVSELDDGERAKTVRKERKRGKLDCARCGYVFPPGEAADLCPSCGLERGRGRSRVETVAGRMEEVSGSRKWDEDRAFVWTHIQRIATERHGGGAAARKYALAQFRNWFGDWPRSRYEPDFGPVDERVRRRVRKHFSAWKRKHFPSQRSPEQRPTESREAA